MIRYQLSIYARDAISVIRVSVHNSLEQARRSLYDYERRHGRVEHRIDEILYAA